MGPPRIWTGLPARRVTRSISGLFNTAAKEGLVRMTGFIRFPRAMGCRSASLLVGSVLLLAAFHPALCSAQSDDAPTEETHPPAPPPKAPVYTFHGHGGGGDDDGAGR